MRLKGIEVMVTAETQVLLEGNEVPTSIFDNYTFIIKKNILTGTVINQVRNAIAFSLQGEGRKVIVTNIIGIQKLRRAKVRL